MGLSSNFLSLINPQLKSLAVCIIFKQVMKKQYNGWHVLMPYNGRPSQTHMLYIYMCVCVFMRHSFLNHSLTNGKLRGLALRPVAAEES